MRRSIIIRQSYYTSIILQLREEAGCEQAIWCKLVSGHKTFTTGVIYRCPNITKESNENIQNAITEVSKGDCIVIGDFNNGNIQWDTLESTEVEDQRCMCLIHEHFLTQHVLLFLLSCYLE